jgi:hypothetical protein
MENIIEKNKETYMRLLKNFVNNEFMILKTLETCGIKNDNSIEIEKQYNIEDELRTGIIIKIHNPVTNEIERIIIDIINAKESYFKQLVEVSHGVGKECKNRILIFTGEQGIPYPDNYSFIIDDFIDDLNNFGQNIYQVYAYIHFFPELSKLGLMKKPCEKSEFDGSELPTLIELKNAEFWQFYYYPDTIFFSWSEDEKRGGALFTHGHLSECGCFQSCFEWDDYGAYLKIFDSDNSGVFEENLDMIKSKFSCSKMEIIKNDEDESELLIHLHGGSLEDFYNLPPQQKIEVADLISSKAKEFNSFFEEMNLDKKEETIEK